MNEKTKKTILEEIDNIEQLAADIRNKIYNGDYDLEIKLNSIKEWAKSIQRKTKQIKK